MNSAKSGWGHLYSRSWYTAPHMLRSHVHHRHRALMKCSNPPQYYAVMKYYFPHEVCKKKRLPCTHNAYTHSHTHGMHTEWHTLSHNECSIDSHSDHPFTHVASHAQTGGSRKSLCASVTAHAIRNRHKISEQAGTGFLWMPRGGTNEWDCVK